MFQEACKELRTVGSALQKLCANLNLKVQKWKGTPPEVMEYLQKLRRRAVVLADSLRVLCPDAGRGSDAVKNGGSQLRSRGAFWTMCP